MDMSFTHDIVVPPASEVWERGMSGASHSITGAFSRALVRSVIRGRGVTQPQSQLHTIGQKVQRRHFLVVL